MHVCVAYEHTNLHAVIKNRMLINPKATSGLGNLFHGVVYMRMHLLQQDSRPAQQGESGPHLFLSLRTWSENDR
jgi:hypothetical protein